MTRSWLSWWPGPHELLLQSSSAKTSTKTFLQVHQSKLHQHSSAQDAAEQCQVFQRILSKYDLKQSAAAALRKLFIKVARVEKNKFGQNTLFFISSWSEFIFKATSVDVG